MSIQQPNRLTEPPKVSVIMNCLNCQRYLAEAINSVYAQTYPDWEIVFWDNASTDNSAKIAQSYDEKLRYFRGEETIPLGAARNKALQQAQGQFIAFLDCDDLWMPEKLEKQIPLFEDPKVGLVFCDTIFFNERGETRRLYDKKTYYTGWCFSKMLANYFLSLQTVVIRRSVLDTQQEWFDERFEMIEESDFFRRISFNWKLAMVNEPLAKWRVHPKSWTWTKPHLFFEETVLMLDKYRRLFPEFDKRFSKEIGILERRMSASKALYFLKTGQKKMGRKCLTSYICGNPKMAVLFFMSFLPTNLFSFFRRLARRLKGKIEP